MQQIKKIFKRYDINTINIFDDKNKENEAKNIHWCLSLIFKQQNEKPLTYEEKKVIINFLNYYRGITGITSTYYSYDSLKI